MKCCVFQEWMFDLSMQQQSVLILACRGPDGVGKWHPSKGIVRFYRATVFKSAVKGRAMKPGEDEGGSFATLLSFQDKRVWDNYVKAFFEHVDGIPHHYYMHLMHGAAIVGYHHPEKIFSDRWLSFYFKCCQDLHLHPETKQVLDMRLNDLDRTDWDNEDEAWIWDQDDDRTDEVDVDPDFHTPSLPGS